MASEHQVKLANQFIEELRQQLYKHIPPRTAFTIEVKPWSPDPLVPLYTLQFAVRIGKYVITKYQSFVDIDLAVNRKAFVNYILKEIICEFRYVGAFDLPLSDEELDIVVVVSQRLNLSLLESERQCRRWVERNEYSWYLLEDRVLNGMVLSRGGNLVSNYSAIAQQVVKREQENIPRVCVGCANFNGSTYNNVQLVCAIHPYGYKSESCPDWTKD